MSQAKRKASLCKEVSGLAVSHSRVLRAEELGVHHRGAAEDGPAVAIEAGFALPSMPLRVFRHSVEHLAARLVPLY